MIYHIQQLLFLPSLISLIAVSNVEEVLFGIPWRFAFKKSSIVANTFFLTLISISASLTADLSKGIDCACNCFDLN